MKERSAVELSELAADIEAELARLKRLEADIQHVVDEVRADPAHADLFRENLALKLHNFYTGIERIFQIVASEVNGALPTGYDWHKRLLERMAQDREGRLSVISAETAAVLDTYLAFRHAVRNIYGFELEHERIDRLVARYPEVWQRVETTWQASSTGFAGWPHAWPRAPSRPNPRAPLSHPARPGKRCAGGACLRPATTLLPATRATKSSNT